MPAPSPSPDTDLLARCAECEEPARHRETHAIYEALVEALARAIDAHDEPGDDHVRRLRHYAVALARRLGMSPPEVAAIGAAAVLHDIGKLGVPAHILSRPGPLTAEEFDKVRAHPQIGAEILASVPLPFPVAPLVLCHHERWDGRGYPAGLRGEEIPLGARVISVVDCYDSLTRRRPYRGPFNHEAALEVLRYESGKSFDPAVVDAFVSLLAAGPPAGVSRDQLATWPVLAPAAAPAQGAALHAIAHARHETVALYDLSRTLSRGLGLSDTARLVAAGLASLVPHDCCALFVLEAGGRLACRFATGKEHERVRAMVLPAGEGSLGRVLVERRLVRNADPGSDFALSAPPGTEPAPLGLASTLATPLLLDGEPVGVLALYHAHAGFYTDEHQRLLEHVSEQIGAVVHASLVLERAREDSFTDALTGLPNTRFLLMHLTQELARAARQGSQVALLVLDLDGFKRINDSAGHATGDRVLREVAAALRGAVRAYDVCARYAGDEFVIMLPECGPAEAEERRQEIEATIKRLRVQTPGGRTLGVTASVGAAIFPADGDAYEDLLAAADARMYLHKRQHRRSRSQGGPRGVASMRRFFDAHDGSDDTAS